MRVRSCFPAHGDSPFSYLGQKILMVENPGGMDVHDALDFLETEWFLPEGGWSETSGPRLG